MRPWVVALLMTSLTFAGCFGGGSEAVTDDCPDDHSADEAMEPNGDVMEDTGETEGSAAGDDNSTGSMSLVQMRQPGNDTGNETGSEPGDEISQSGAVDDGMAMEGDEACPDHHDEDEEDTEGNATTGAEAYLTSTVQSGEAPLLVNFTFGVTEIAQDEFLTWTLDVDGDGTADAEGNGNNLEGNFSYTYVTPGNFTAMFEAEDGVDSWNATVAIEVIEAGELPGEGEEPSGPYFFDDAEGDGSQWNPSEADPVMGAWHQSDAFASSGSQSWAATMEPLHIYSDEVDIWMDSIPIDLTTAPRATLSFVSQGGTEEGFDFMRVAVSGNGGASFSELATYSGLVENWELQTFSLNKYVGGEVILRFQLTSDANCSGVTPIPGLCTTGTTGPGWFVDDILVA